MVEESPLSAGEVVGPYRIVARIGVGGMGHVYRAEEQSLERVVALKVMSASLAQDPTFVARFRTEAKAAASLVHPNVVNVFGVGEVRGAPYIAMEFVDGESIAQKVAREKRLPPRQVAEWAVEALRGLEAASKRGIVHRDIKPQNLLINRDGQLKIADFGLAKQVNTEVALTQAGVALGTPLYMSPEQGRGEGVDWRSDVYSLGATMYHAIGGKAPFEADSALAVLTKHATSPLTPLNTVRQDIPAPLSALIGKMLAKTQADRPKSHAAIIGELERLIPTLPFAVLPPAASAGGDADDSSFGKLALAAGLINAAQLKGAMALQEKMRAAGKPVRTLEDILVASKLVTQEKAEMLKDRGLQAKLADHADEGDSGGHPNLEVSEAAGQAMPPTTRGPVCPLCRLAVRHEQVQSTCPECGVTQHSECMASYGGCGNEGCAKSPRSMSMAATGRPEPARVSIGGTSGGGSGLPKLAIRAGLLLGVAAAAYGIWNAVQKSGQDYFDEAKNLDGASKGRLSIFSVDETSKDASAGSGGLSGETQRKLEHQISLYRKALEKDPSLLLAHFELANCLVQLNRKPEALAEYETVLRGQPDNKDARFGAGNLQYQAGEYTKAEEHLRKAAEGGIADAWLQLAILYQDKLAQPARAVDPLKKYLSEKPVEGNAWGRLAAAEHAAGNESGAMTAADHAVQRGTTNAEAYLVKARIAFKAGKFEEAAASAMDAAERTSGNASATSFEARRLAGQSFVKAGKPQAGREQLRLARGMKPEDVALAEMVGDLEMAAGDWNSAARSYKEAWDRGSNNTDHLFKAGTAAWNMRDGVNAAAAFEILSRKKPDTPDMKLWVARAWLLAGSIESASPAVARAIDEKPDDPARQALRVWELALKVETEQAIRLGEELLVKYPGNTEIMYRLVFACKRAHREDTMLKYLALAADAGMPEATFDYADYLHTVAGNVQGAVKYYRLYIEKTPVGYHADLSRQLLVALNVAGSSDTTTRPPPDTTHTPPPQSGETWKWMVNHVNEIMAEAPSSTEESVDRVYRFLICLSVSADAYAGRNDAVAGLNSQIYAADTYVRQNARSYLRVPDSSSELAAWRSARVKQRFSEISAACDHLVPAVAAAAKKLNPAAASEIADIASKWGAAMGKDRFERAAIALDLSARMVAAARGPAGADALEKLEARSNLSENPVQKAVAGAYALCELLGKGRADTEVVSHSLEADDDNADTGLSQLAVGFAKATQILILLRVK